MIFLLKKLSEWPDKMYSISYILYPIIGCVITISTALVISLLTRGRKSAKLVRPECLHKLVRPKPSVSCKEQNNNGDKFKLASKADDRIMEIELSKMN